MVRPGEPAADRVIPRLDRRSRLVGSACPGADVATQRGGAHAPGRRATVAWDVAAAGPTLRVVHCPRHGRNGRVRPRVPRRCFLGREPQPVFRRQLGLFIIFKS